ncbi:MAG TPA: oligoribonuclease [Candidatus Saccharimonadales bacterium]|nr:oligoribonuclease [Candidatus Saccharimonadales bacterium]
MSKILWIDLEMTGLNPNVDRIVEVGALITDWDFNVLATYESGVKHDKELLQRLFKVNPWAADHAESTSQLLRLSAKSPSSDKVQGELIAFVNDHFNNEPVLLAGNSIHQDRRFIRKYWPELEARLHYRMLDVSAFKVVMMGKYNIKFEKTETHRALDDIKESIEELRSYLKKFN